LEISIQPKEKLMKNGTIASMTDISAAIKGYAAATRGPAPTDDGPYSSCQKKNFPLYQLVQFVNLPSDSSLLGQTGVILGTSFVNVIDHYIVLLFEPTDTHLAICMTESCLEAI
jgi:hypothetical protein